MSDRTPRDTFLQSVERCAASPEFLQSFYEDFMAKSDEVRHKFRHTDFEKQNRMLLRSLRLSAGATAGDPEALREIHERAETHGRNQLNIPRRLYDMWLEALIETAAQFDEQWDESVESAWRRILGHVIDHMLRHY